MSENPIPERRQSDRLVDYRLKQMEEQNAKTNKAIEETRKEVSELKTSMFKEFADLKETLFERPIFVTYELFKIELESRDRVLDSLKKENGDQITTTRHYIGMAVMLSTAIFGPVIIRKLWGI